jgi:hypothetical protein
MAEGRVKSELPPRNSQRWREEDTKIMDALCRLLLPPDIDERM